MDKVLFYYPKINDDNDADSYDLYQGLPLSVLTLVAQMDSNKYQIKVVDGRIEQYSYKKCLEWIGEDTICVAISAMTSYQIKDGLGLAERIRNRYPFIKLIWGGWHPSLMPVSTVQHKLVDIAAIGQGEETIPKLVDALHSGEDLKRVPNLIYEDESHNVIRTNRKGLKYDNTKSIKHGLNYINVENYIQSLWGHERVVGYESSRGCIFHCTFCSIGAVYNRHWDCLSAKRVVDDVNYLYDQYELDAIHFFDNNFFVNAKRAEEIASGFLQRKINIHWDGTSVVNQFINFKDAYIENLKKSGFYRVIIGVESGNEEVLKKIGKPYKREDVIKLVEKCKHHNIQASLSFMVGFPWNPEQDFLDTIALIEEIRTIYAKTEIMLFIFSPYLGTELYQDALDYGMVQTEKLEDWADFTYGKVNTPWISKQLRHKMDRYIRFFGTKEMSLEMKEYLQGGNRV